MSKSFRGRLLAAIFTAGVGSALVSAQASAETLADAIAMAYESNPNLQAQRANQRALDESYVQARSGWRPSLSATAGATYVENRRTRESRVIANRSLVGDGVSYGNSGRASLSFSQPLWTGGRTAAAVSAAEAEVLAGREALRRTEAQILLNVIQAYADVRRDMEALRIRQENVTVLQRQLEESQARFDVGEITRTDVAQSQARLAAAQALLQNAEAQLGISRATYATFVGQNPGELAPEPSLAYLLPGNVEDAFAVAEQNSPILRGQQFTEQASRARVAGARAERMPNISLSASSTFGPAEVDPYRRELFDRESQVGVNVTMPLFNGGLTSSRVRQSVERNNVDRINIETQRRSVLQTIAQSWNQLVASRTNISSTAEQVAAARIAAEGTRQEQQVGLRTTLDVLNAEQELRSAELNQVSARRDEYVAAANVIASMGRLEARNLTPEVAQYDSKANFRKLRITWGWVPWEEPISIVDRVLTIAPAPNPAEKPVEATIPPGLQPGPASAATAPQN